MQVYFHFEYLISVITEGSEIQIFTGIHDRFGNVSSWKHCVTTTNNSLHELSTISQAK